MLDTQSVDQKYSIDTSSLIDGYADAVGRNIIENLIRQDKLKAPPGVLGELEVGGDKVFEWAKLREKSLIKELSPVSASRLGDLVDKYGDPFSDPDSPGMIYRGLIKKGTSSDADPEVIALALDYNWTVVSEEQSGIKGACKIEKVNCISLKKLFETEMPKRERQLPLV